MILWIVFIFALAYGAFATAAANISYETNPRLALRLYPSHPLALTNQAEADLKSQSPSTAAALLERSIREQGLNSEAIALMGFVRELGGDKGLARQFVQLSGQMSRRNVLAQLWMIEDKVSNNDISGAVAHYDTVLRSSVEQAELLVPILVSALDEPEIRSALVPYLKSRPSWAPSFWAHSAQSAKDPAAIAAMILRVGGLPSDDASQGVQRELLVRLAGARAYGATEEFYRSLPGADPKVPASPRLTETSIDTRYPPIAWQLTDEGAVGARVEAGDAPSVINIRAFAGTGEQGVALRKLLLLRAGSYRLKIDQSLIVASESGRVDWRLECAKEGRGGRIWPAKDGVSTAGRIDANVQIPSDCSAVFIELMLSGGLESDGIELLIRSIDLVPAGIAAPAA